MASPISIIFAPLWVSYDGGKRWKTGGKRRRVTWLEVENNVELTWGVGAFGGVMVGGRGGEKSPVTVTRNSSYGNSIRVTITRNSSYRNSNATVEQFSSSDLIRSLDGN